MFLKILNLIKKQITKRRVIAVVVILAAFYFLTRGAAVTSQIQTEKVQRQDLAEDVTASGTVKAKDETTLHFGVGGKVASVNVKEGDQVTAGETIAYLDATNYQAAERQAQQDVLAADAVLQQTYNNIHLNGAENYDQRVQRQTAETAKNKAFDAEKVAERNLADTVLTSPISGTVVSLDIVPDEEILTNTDI